eukprot:TRINITY_DN12525_c0_g1_i1.p1 TRINITY_DN12525_c0_g1~~TRINITY_DN12525_c0_g1_i1.p1  ORF type:complete len:553 (-),score=42.91 TRINITY_DN12525_c0_g1_i1:217-1836(-)
MSKVQRVFPQLLSSMNENLASALRKHADLRSADASFVAQHTKSLIPFLASSNVAGYHTPLLTKFLSMPHLNRVGVRVSDQGLKYLILETNDVHKLAAATCKLADKVEPWGPGNGWQDKLLTVNALRASELILTRIGNEALLLLSKDTVGSEEEHTKAVIAQKESGMTAEDILQAQREKYPFPDTQGPLPPGCNLFLATNAASSTGSQTTATHVFIDGNQLRGTVKVNTPLLTFRRMREAPLPHVFPDGYLTVPLTWRMASSAPWQVRACVSVVHTMRRLFGFRDSLSFVHLTPMQRWRDHVAQLDLEELKKQHATDTAPKDTDAVESDTTTPKVMSVERGFSKEDILAELEKVRNSSSVERGHSTANKARQKAARRHRPAQTIPKDAALATTDLDYPHNIVTVVSVPVRSLYLARLIGRLAGWFTGTVFPCTRRLDGLIVGNVKTTEGDVEGCWGYHKAYKQLVFARYEHHVHQFFDMLKDQETGAHLQTVDRARRVLWSAAGEGEQRQIMELVVQPQPTGFTLNFFYEIGDNLEKLQD